MTEISKPIRPIITEQDKRSVSYRMGYEDGFALGAFRHPCKGNAIAENAYYFGFLAGQSARAKS